MGKVKMGSVYADGLSLPVGNNYIGPFSIGSTAIDKIITWNRVGKLLIATEPVLLNISWHHVNEAGYIHGRPICIDGQHYICRSLRLGIFEGSPNSEWKMALREHGDDDRIWHWSKNFFWGADVPELYPDEKTIAGFSSPIAWGVTKPERFVGLGFRPVLEEIVGGVKISEDLLGKKVVLFGPNGSIGGLLEEITDYDLLVKTDHEANLSKFNQWVSCDLDPNELTVDRQAVACAQLIS